MKRTGDVVVVDSEPLMRHQEQLDKRFAALERIKQLESQYEFAVRYVLQLEDMVRRLVIPMESVLPGSVELTDGARKLLKQRTVDALPPTEKQLDSIRPLMMFQDMWKLGEWRKHMIGCRGPEAIANWPQWAKDGADSDHLPKAAMAEIIYYTLMGGQ